MITKTIVSLVATVAMAGGAQAALHDRGGGLIYDDDLNITWMADANLAATNNFGVTSIQSGGGMGWNQSWIGAMNAANYLGFNNWRLPTVSQTNAVCTYDGQGTYRYSCTGNETGSELGHLFYKELGGVVGVDLGEVHNANYGLFKNIQLQYWTGTEYNSLAANGSYWYAWDFNFHTGEHGANFKGNGDSAWAVIDGDVAAVPEPKIYAMMVVGMVMIGAVERLQRCLSNA